MTTNEVDRESMKNDKSFQRAWANIKLGEFEDCDVDPEACCFISWCCGAQYAASGKASKEYSEVAKQFDFSQFEPNRQLRLRVLIRSFYNFGYLRSCQLKKDAIKTMRNPTQTPKPNLMVP